VHVPYIVPDELFFGIVVIPMIQAISEFTSYTPIFIFLATILDVFFITGYIFYGFAMLSTVGVLILSGSISMSELIIAGSLGTILGNYINFFIGKKFGSSKYIQKHLEHKYVKKIHSLIQNHNLILLMCICRFVTFLRPAYALVLGTLDVSTKRFILYESIISIVWITFWITVIVTTGETLQQLFA